MFVGYEGSTKGYKLWNPQTHKFIVSTDVTFKEKVFPLHTQTPNPSQPSSTLLSPPEYVDLTLPESDDEDAPSLPAIPAPTIPDPAVLPQQLPPAPPQLPPTTPLPTAEPPRRSTRLTRGIRRPDPMNANPDRDRIQQGLRPWIPSIWNNSADAFLAATKVTPTGDPTSYDYAMQTPEAYQWQKAMEDELKSLQENGTWTLVDLPDGRTTVKNRWVYLTKRDTKGDIIRYKARLVAKGFTQTAGLDYEGTFAPVARLDSLRLLLAIAAVFDWEVHHVDIKTAYLNGHLNEEIYMDQPRGFEIQGEEKKVCRLLKAIYGLKQAGRQWHEHLQRSLTDYGYKKLVSCDASIFFKHHDGGGPNHNHSSLR